MNEIKCDWNPMKHLPHLKKCDAKLHESLSFFYKAAIGSNQPKLKNMEAAREHRKYIEKHFSRIRLALLKSGYKIP